MFVETDRPRRYFAFHYRMLRILGLGWWHHPDENNRNNFPTFYVAYSVVIMLVWIVGFIGLETMDPFTGDKDMTRFMFSLSLVVTDNLTCIKLILFFLKHREIQETVYILEIHLYKFYQNNIKNRAAVRLSRILTCAYLFVGWATICNSTINGIIQDFQWKVNVANLNETQIHPERTLPQPIYIPWDFQKDGLFITTFTLEALGLFWTGHIIMIIDTFIASVLLHIGCQFTVLQEAIETVYERTIAELAEKKVLNEDAAVALDDIDKVEHFVTQQYTEEEIDKALIKTLENCIKQHQTLIRL